MGAIALLGGVAVALGLGYAVGGGSETASKAAGRATTAPSSATTPVAEKAPAVVWVQAGHVPPGEPGYRDHTGSDGEAAFNTRVRDAVVTLLEREGIDARPLGARVDPLGAPGAAFVSIHHDSPGGPAAIGYAVQGNENYYRGEGGGTPSPTPYPDSAPHRTPATVVTPAVQAASRDLAKTVARSFGAVYTPANGAFGSNTGVQSPGSNRRMMNFYGYYRTNADARILIECGSRSNDAKFLANTPLVSRAIAIGIIDYLDGVPRRAPAPGADESRPPAEGSDGSASGKVPLPEKSS